MTASIGPSCRLKTTRIVVGLCILAFAWSTVVAILLFPPHDDAFKAFDILALVVAFSLGIFLTYQLSSRQREMTRICLFFIASLACGFLLPTIAACVGLAALSLGYCALVVAQHRRMLTLS